MVVPCGGIEPPLFPRYYTPRYHSRIAGEERGNVLSHYTNRYPLGWVSRPYYHTQKKSSKKEGMKNRKKKDKRKNGFIKIRFQITTRNSKKAPPACPHYLYPLAKNAPIPVEKDVYKMTVKNVHPAVQ